MVVQLSLHLVPQSSSEAADCVPTPCSLILPLPLMLLGSDPGSMPTAPSTSLLALASWIWPTAFLFDCGWTVLWGICCRQTIPQLSPSKITVLTHHIPQHFTLLPAEGVFWAAWRKIDNQDRGCPYSGNLAKDVRCQTNKCYCTMKRPPKCLPVPCGLKCENMTSPFQQ